MKKILIVLVVFVGFAGTAMSQTKVGHVKSQVLWDTLKLSKSAETQMVEFQGMLAQEIRDLETDITKLETEYQELQGKTGISPTLLSVKQRQIQTKYEEYQKRQQSAQYELQAFRVELEAPIEKLIRDAVEVVAKRDKYDYIMDVNSGLFVNPEKDLTEIVMKELLRLEKEQMASTPPPSNENKPGGN